MTTKSFTLSAREIDGMSGAMNRDLYLLNRFKDAGFDLLRDVVRTINPDGSITYKQEPTP